MNAIAAQSLFDVAIQENGNVFTFIDWAQANDISPTAALVPGVTLKVPAIAVERLNTERVDKVFLRRKFATLFATEDNNPTNFDYSFPQTFPYL